MGLKVTGMGLICGLGDSPSGVYGNMCAGNTSFRAIYSFDGSKYAQNIAGQLAPETDARLTTLFEDEDRALALAKYAGYQALGVEQGSQVKPDSRRGLVMATNFGPMDTFAWSWSERLDTGTIDDYTFEPARDYVNKVAAALGCGGPVAQISMSCASGAAAFAVAWDMIAQGRADTVLVLAYDSMSEYCWCGLSNLHTITKDTMRPFDERRSGTIFSEGGAAMLVGGEDAPGDALAWISGVATGNNAFHLTAPRPEAEGSRQVMEAAMAQAGVSAVDIDHLCAHATSTNANDLTESAAIRNILKDRVMEVSVSAHKSQMGHLLGAAGLAEAIVTVLSMRNSLIPPMPGTDILLDPKCMPLDCVTGTARSRKICTAVSNSAGIGGNNASLVLTSSKKSGLPKINGKKVYLNGLAWVLPQNTGSGRGLLDNLQWLNYEEGCNAAMEAFNAKPYLSSVKGYLDPAGACLLAACKMALGTTETSARRGMSTATVYGSSKSAYAFMEQLVKKGPRFASPMIFPHGYANTPGNLAAIEFGLAGPHMVFYGPQNIREALNFSIARLVNGDADEMLTGFYEAFYQPAFLDGMQVLSGAVVMRLSCEDTEGSMGMLSLTDDVPSDSAQGSLGALADILQTQLNL